MDESTGKEALKIIAEARQSHVLLTFLETGAIETPMETGAAYARLGIDDRSISDDLVISVFNFRVSLNQPIFSKRHLLRFHSCKMIQSVCKS